MNKVLRALLQEHRHLQEEVEMLRFAYVVAVLSFHNIRSCTTLNDARGVAEDTLAKLHDIVPGRPDENQSI